MADILVPTVEMNKMSESDYALTGVFGDAAKIEKQGPEDEYVVTVTLDDGVVRGGQEAKFVLKHQKYLPGMEDVPESSDVYLCKKMEVQNVDLTSELPEFYFVPRYFILGTDPFSSNPKAAYDWQNIEVRSQDPDNTRFIMHKFMQKGTFAEGDPEDQSKRLAIFRIFTNADDLVALLHEGGHLKGGKIQQEAGEEYFNFHNLIEKNGDGEDAQITPEELTIWKKVIQGEAQADSRIIELVDKLRKEGKDIFPGEGDELFGIRKCIQLQLMNYISTGNNRFSKSIPSEELASLTNPDTYEGQD